MSVSTDGILVFGVDLGAEEDGLKLPWLKQDSDYDDEDDNEYEEEDMEFEEWYYRLVGVSSKDLWAEYYAWAEGWKNGDWRHDSDSVKVFEEQNPEWSKKLNQNYADQKKALEECPIDIVYHCSGEYRMVIIAVRDTETSASRGYPAVIESLDIDPKEVKAAQDFCKEYGIPFEDPKWLLASYWN